MKRFALAFTRWCIFYPITLPIMLVYGLPTTAVFFAWEWVLENKGKGFDSRGDRALRAYGRIISKPFFWFTEVDKRLCPKQKSFKF